MTLQDNARKNLSPYLPAQALKARIGRCACAGLQFFWTLLISAIRVCCFGHDYFSVEVA